MTWFRCGMKKASYDEFIEGTLTKIDYKGSGNLRNYAFYGFSDLIELNIPNITRLRTSSISQCTSLTSLVLPSVATIEQLVFSGSSSLSDITLGYAHVCYLFNINAFNGTPFAADGAGGTIHVPSNILTEYENHPTWQSVMALNANNRIQAIT